WRTSAFASCLAEGIGLPKGLTTTVPTIPGCTSQKNLYVPALVNFTLSGLGGPSGRPLSSRWLPLKVVVFGGPSSAGFSPTLGTLPLNQNGLPAASLTPLTTVLPGTINGSGA